MLRPQKRNKDVEMAVEFSQPFLSRYSLSTCSSQLVFVFTAGGRGSLACCSGTCRQYQHLGGEGRKATNLRPGWIIYKTLCQKKKCKKENLYLKKIVFPCSDNFKLIQIRREDTYKTQRNVVSTVNSYHYMICYTFWHAKTHIMHGG